MSTASGLKSSYVTKFGAAALLVVALMMAAAINVYTRIAPQLSGGAQQQLLSGVLSILLVFIVALLFIGASIGRESLSALNILTDRARQIERGDLSADLETNKNDELGELYRSFAAMRDALQGRIQETERQNQQLQNCALNYCDVMEEVGNGDLSQRLDEDVEIEAMATLARDFNQMMDRLEQTISEVYMFTDGVSNAAEVLARQTEESMRASVRIHSAAQEIAAGTGQTGTETLDSFDAVETDLNGDSSARAIETVETGVELDDTLEAIEGLSDRMDRIDEISEFISDVANETNMLALNAGIEASKVDGSGTEGFQVVAEEVKSLAEETKESAGEIDAITDDIRGGTNNAVNSILRQQAALLSMMHDQVEDLSDSSEDLRMTLAQLQLTDVSEANPELESIDVEGADD